MYRALILVILEPKSYMAQAHKLQIGLGKYFRSILGVGSGFLQLTMNLYGFLVVKQESKCGESSSPRQLWGVFMELVSEVDGGTFQSCRRKKWRWKWEEQGFWYKKPEWKERRTFSFTFFSRGKNSVQVWWGKRIECGEGFEHLRKFWVHMKWAKRKEKHKVWGFREGRLYLGIFLVGSLEWGFACEPLCDKANRKKGSLEAKQIFSWGENNLVSTDSGISFFSF